MKRISVLLLFFLSLTTISGLGSCGPDDGLAAEQSPSIPGPDPEPNPNPPVTGNQVKITIGSSTFTATLQDNATANAFKALLPMTINMSELNNNEKYYRLSQSLPVNSSKPGTIQNGDLMLYGSDTLVLFYKGFSTSYSYTRIGRVDNPSGLQSALGQSNVTVKFEKL